MPFLSLLTGPIGKIAIAIIGVFVIYFYGYVNGQNSERVKAMEQEIQVLRAASEEQSKIAEDYQKQMIESEKKLKQVENDFEKLSDKASNTMCINSSNTKRLRQLFQKDAN